MRIPKLNKENYYSNEIDKHYMSNSQYKKFLICEAATMAEINGEWMPSTSEALLFGQYVHAWLEGEQAFNEFKKNTPSLFTQKGHLYKQYQLADLMIESIQNDDLCMFALQGEKEVIITAELFGVPWKGKLDVYNPAAGRFADLKTARSLREKVWDPEIGYCSFVEAYGYIAQMALYAEIEKRMTGRNEWLEPLIVGISKEDPPDKAVINIDQVRMEIELEDIEKKMDRIIQVKYGGEKPERCGKCRYCRATKRLNGIIHFSELVS
ncbi:MULTISPECIES: PD-(D/E)XK nuclease-like domain-containing protein [Bacillus subtilis group]|uniref:PD-(D/E)XK nuclease-like domain-containing protein n=1 Tax=Bacillus subtilis group TaxID=653685 RepID=UPI00292A50E1|nr:PD-(D/E)XK nuclease-like domain-containing protein [Bacillus paralicheniformis]